MKYKLHEIGYAGGEFEHQLTIDEMPKHNHNYKYSNLVVGVYGDGAEENGGSGGWMLNLNRMPETHTSNTGGDQPHNNMPPYRVVQFIEYVGF